MEEAVVMSSKGEEGIDLPPGFRFHPSDEEIITHYLTRKVVDSGFKAIAIAEVDFNKTEPWDLPVKAKSTGNKESYFFFQRDRKYPTGMRTNRATAAGYWKATGKDKEIYRGKAMCLVGMKKTLVFYKGRAPKGEKTNWVMHEFRLEGKFSYSNLPKAAKDEWVVCRVLHKSTGVKKSPMIQYYPHDELVRMKSLGDDFFLDYASLPPLMDSDGGGCSYLQDAGHVDHHQSNYMNMMSYGQQDPNSNSNLNLGQYCKLEQTFSSNNQSIPSLSQDTGLSSEMNEISSKYLQIGNTTTKPFQDMPNFDDTFWPHHNADVHDYT